MNVSRFFIALDRLDSTLCFNGRSGLTMFLPGLSSRRWRAMIDT